MTDYLVDPTVGKTTIKIDPSVQSATTLWPSVKMMPFEATPVITGSATSMAVAAVNVPAVWNLTFNKVNSGTKTPPIPSSGLYHVYVSHYAPSAVGYWFPIFYSINGGPKIEMGRFYYEGHVSMSAFIELKQNDTLQFWGMYTYGSSTVMYPTYSKLIQWSIRKLADGGTDAAISAF